ncbi:hypothetical protein SP38_21 [Salmonella phage 38]|uniref:Uncharacterized protein n=1 Tax=Salmonella phage 38 TaxID=1654891 RepID=A0A0N7CFC7_9CAUD|nr:guanylate kinase [Salmonella phage 38]AKJ73623.1 hypothetical protein SP38_21 [Salmonella phage 38]
MAKIIVVKGTSGTGKGTRVVQFIEWLRTKLEPTELTYTIGDKTRPFGLKFEELKLIFVGQYTVSNKSGLASWTSMDAIHAATGSGDIARDLVKGWLAQGYTWCARVNPSCYRINGVLNGCSRTIRLNLWRCFILHTQTAISMMHASVVALVRKQGTPAGHATNLTPRSLRSRRLKCWCWVGKWWSMTTAGKTCCIVNRLQTLKNSKQEMIAN